MKAPEHILSHFRTLGLQTNGRLHCNLSAAALYEQALRRHEVLLAQCGALVARTDPHTGRSPLDRFIVSEPSSRQEIGWSPTNQSVEPDVFDHLLQRMTAYVGDRDLFVQDLYAGADPEYRLPVRIITETAWHSLFAHNMFIRDHDAKPYPFAPGFTVLDLCGFRADPSRDGTRSEVFVVIHLDRRLVLIGGTRYGGEIKKAIFSALNFMLPAQRVFPMHCAANLGPDGKAAVFFGLSGTGKTTLSADAGRILIGDDEHGWSSTGLFNFEGGSYAKMIRLSAEHEPEIYGAATRFGTLLENVVLDRHTRMPVFDDNSITENTRGAYPLSFIPNASATGRSGHPEHILFLTADAFGVMPPVAKLTPEQAMYHFLSGYTAKVAGTERDVTAPKATFSACFGEPFMVRPPVVYAEMLGEKIRTHRVQCWLINTGWTGGAYGQGRRISLHHTRAMVNAILSGALDTAETFVDPVFGLAVPRSVPQVPPDIMTPRDAWDAPEAYDRQAHRLAEMFARNFEKYAAVVPESVLSAGPDRLLV